MDWLLKVVQAAVRADFLEIDLSLSKSLVEFRFPGACCWRREDIEGSFYDPESGCDLSLQALKEALWSVSLHNARWFCLGGIGRRHSFGVASNFHAGLRIPPT